MAAPGMPDPEVKASEAAVEADDSFSAEVVDLLVVGGDEAEGCGAGDPSL